MLIDEIESSLDESTTEYDDDAQSADEGHDVLRDEIDSRAGGIGVDTDPHLPRARLKFSAIYRSKH